MWKGRTRTATLVRPELGGKDREDMTMLLLLLDLRAREG